MFEIIALETFSEQRFRGAESCLPLHDVVFTSFCIVVLTLFLSAMTFFSLGKFFCLVTGDDIVCYLGLMFYTCSDSPFASADAAYVLAFSIIMLATDLHSSSVCTMIKIVKGIGLFIVLFGGTTPN